MCLDTWQTGSLKLFEENLIQSFLKVYCDLVKKCQVILSIILTLLLGKLSWLDILENLDVLTLKKKIRTLTWVDQLSPTTISTKKLKLEPCESIRYLFRKAKRF